MHAQTRVFHRTFKSFTGVLGWLNAMGMLGWFNHGGVMLKDS